ncbi:MAG TPA: hypothetical protein VNK43_00960 [Gemmatimonadales bacterium]|nr:hypothetical protein [Gemmatimonadales bacterium]
MRVEPGGFPALVGRAEPPLVAVSPGGISREHFQYLASYRGLALRTKSPEPLALPRAEVVAAKGITIPGLQRRGG